MSAVGKIRLTVLISGRGSNLQAILDQAASGELPAEVVAVISNQPGVYGLERARQAGVPALELDHRNFADRPAFEAALIEQMDRYQPDLVILAGFMRVLTADFTERYLGRLLNIHPSLLPNYPGLHTHQRALDAGDREHGASVHVMIPALDAGPVIAQTRIAIAPGDTAESLAARLLPKEHALLVQVVRWFSEGRLRFDAERVVFDERHLTGPLPAG